jgi:CAAX amino protease
MTLAFSSNPDIKVIEMFGNNLPLAVGCLTVSALLAIGTFLLIRKRI